MSEQRWTPMALPDARTQLGAWFVHAVAIGDLQDPMQFWRYAEALGWPQPPNLAVVVRIVLDAERRVWIGDRQKRLLRQRVEQALDTVWPERLQFWLEATECSVLVQGEGVAKTQMVARAAGLATQVSLPLGARLALGLSRLAENPLWLTRALKSARQAAMQAALLRQPVLHSDDMEEGMDSPSLGRDGVSDDSQETALESEIQRLADWLASLRHDMSRPLELKKQQILERMLGILQRCREQGVVGDAESFSANGTFGRLLRLQTAAELCDWLDGVGREFLLGLRDKVQQSRSQVIQAAIQYIQEHLHEDLSLTTIAAHCAVSHYHLSHLFRKETGTTVTAFIKESRLHRALTLLAGPQMSIAEVAYRVGFEDPNYFSKAFRARFGVSPSEYRKSASRRPAGD
jgi:AraC-like DNA-binding protein